MIKRYSFSNEQQASELILALAHEDNELTFDKITGTKTTAGIRCNIIPEPKYEYNEETGEKTEIVVEHLTYDVDVFWRDKVKYGWGIYEVEPKTPNHKFA